MARVLGAWVLVVVVVGGVLAGCSGGDDADVATLASGGGSEDAVSDQRRGADALYNCLVEAGLPAVLNPIEDGNAEVTWASEGYDILVKDPEGMGIAIPGKSGEFAEGVEQAFWEDHQGAYALFVDDQDHTVTWEACYEKSGYVSPYLATLNDPTAELKEKQALVEVTNEWAACARENGQPQIKDITAEADGWETYPEALLPLDTTVEELRALLEVCPTFDQAQLEAQMQPDFDYEKDFVPFPSVGIEKPAGYTDETLWAELDSATTSPELEHYEELTEILYEKLMAAAETLAPAVSESAAATAATTVPE